MKAKQQEPQVFRILREDALDVKHTPFGSVGKVFSGEGIEAVRVSKQDEAIDPEWFSQSTVDLILVVQGQLHVEFEQHDLASQVLDPGDLLVLPADTRCRAYRWPRERREPTVFVAVYPVTRA
jgi:quercetin dioxygenase-like cupin family protein